MKLSRFPDKPVASDVAILNDLEPGRWLCQAKPDGFRTVVGVGLGPGGSLALTSRHDEPIRPSKPFAAAMRAALGHLPAGTLLDGEYLGRRPGADGKLPTERLWLFDVLRWGESDWRHREEAAARFACLRAIVPPELVVPWTDRDYRPFFERCKLDPTFEGVVLKAANSPLILSVRGSQDNRQWIKCKFRAGLDGQTRIA